VGNKSNNLYEVNMGSGIIISTRSVGGHKQLLKDWAIDYPPSLNDGGDHLTLRDLITLVVYESVAEFKKRQNNSKFVKVLSAKQINEAAIRGKIDMGEKDLIQEVDEEAAVATAIQAFEDSLYLVIIDGQEQRELDREVYLRPDSRITFLRLVMLAGG
jgi:hypothetical protein